MIWHALQLAISINLELVFCLWWIWFLPIWAVNNSILNMKISSMGWLPNMQQLKQLTLRWRSFPGCGREHVAVVFASSGCQYLINGCLQPIETQITQDAKLKIIDAPLTIILRMRQWACRCSYSQYRQSTSDKWMSATNWNINHPRCEAKNHWRSTDAHSQNRAVTVLLFLWLYKLPIHRLCIMATRSLCNYSSYNTTNRWCFVDAHSQNGTVIVLMSRLLIRAANTSVTHNIEQITV